MDPIRRKLKIIDKQLAQRRDFHRQIISSCPLLFAAAGLIVGILTQKMLNLPVGVWLTVLMLSAATAFLFFWLSAKYHTLYAILALVCFGCLGAVRLSGFQQPCPNNIRNFIADERKLATIRGTIVTEPYVNNNRNWAFARLRYTDPASSFYLKVTEAQTVDDWAKVSGTVYVYCAEPLLDLAAGDYIQAYCWLDRFERPGNPGQFDIAEYMARKNIFITASVRSRDAIELLKETPASTFIKIKSKIQQAATQSLVGDISTEEPGRGLLQALLLGYRRDIDSESYSAFRKTGLLHFISLSGMHFGILIGIIWWLCKTAGLTKQARAAFCIIAIGVFLLTVPPRAPALRAAIICFVFCLALLFRRHPNSINTLSLAAVILLLIRPTHLFEAGWQLSFATVLAILLFTEKIMSFLQEKTDYWSQTEPSDALSIRIVKQFTAKVITLFAVGFSAWLGGAGILLYHFYTINPLTFIWTVIVFPLVAGILVIGFLKIILSLLLPSAAAILGVMVTGLSGSLIWLVKTIAHLDISQILIGRVSIALILFYYGLVLFTGLVYLRRPAIKKAVCTITALFIIILLAGAKWQKTHQDNLIMTCLDVGHGQAILVQLPGKTNLLLDAGSHYRSNIGRRIVRPFLDYSGINKIDAVIISHNDTDHINGIPEIARDCEVETVYASGAFIEAAKQQYGTAAFLREQLAENSLDIRPLQTDLYSDSTATVKILLPTPDICRDKKLSNNDKSVVCLIEFASVKILLCADIENFAQRELLALFPGLKAEIVVLPHHGSVRTLQADFLERLNADILICSCGPGQLEKQPPIKVKNNAQLLSTAKNGAVTVRIEKNGIKTYAGYKKP